MTFTHRLATGADRPAITFLMDRAIAKLQSGFLTPEQVVASRASMGMDTQLISDRTYWLVFEGERLVGCGGWDRRKTPYGGDHAADLRDPATLDPALDPARIRAMYTHPDYTRRGVGRLILSVCEAAAADAGFARVELMATLAGEPLYRASGYREIDRTVAKVGDVGVPLIMMGKSVAETRNDQTLTEYTAPGCTAGARAAPGA